jgi:L-fuconolactonase
LSDFPSPKRIDSHHHVWNPSQRDYPWLTDSRIRRPFGPEQLRPHLEANRIDGTILVQTVSDLDETREFLALAAGTDFVSGVVGWLNMTDPWMPNTLAELVDGEHGEYLVGVRHQVHDEDDPDWLLQEPVQGNLQALADAGLVYDLLVRTRELPAAITVARDFPHLRFVIDHLAKPPIATGEIAEWSALMHEFAPLVHVACKLSGMVTEADPERWTPDDLRPYVETVYEIFGRDRLMFGSDWPVCLLAASYDEVVAALHTVLTDLGVLDDVTEAAIFGNTAIHWYRLDDRHPLLGVTTS